MSHQNVRKAYLKTGTKVISLGLNPYKYWGLF